MGRLKTVAISEELRKRLSQATFETLQLATIPTGRDPRKFNKTEAFPQATVEVCSTLTIPHGIGGGTKAIHGVAIYVAFVYEDADDIATIKNKYGEELYDWLCDNMQTDVYELYTSNQGGGAPGLDYQPNEEAVYRASGSNIALLKMEFAVDQITTYSIRS